MKTSSKFICQLSVNEQEQIRVALMNCEELENEDNIEEIVNNAMDDRICLLENFINLESIITDDLQSICNNWEYDFKGDLLEDIDSIVYEYTTIKEYVTYLINNCFPIWIEESKEESPENTQLYIDYQMRFKNIVGDL